MNNMSNENIIHLVQCDTGGGIAGDGPFTNVENEVVPIAQFNVHGCVHLSWTDGGRGAHENDTHVVGLNLFGAGKPVRRAGQPRMRADALKQEALFPANLE